MSVRIVRGALERLIHRLTNGEETPHDAVKSRTFHAENLSGR